MVAMVHCEGGRGGSGEEGRLCSRILCHAHLHLAVNGMETGYCRDIQGEVGLMFTPQGGREVERWREREGKRETAVVSGAERQSGLAMIYANNNLTKEEVRYTWPLFGGILD